MSSSDRSTALRQRTPLRRPWHSEFLHMQMLVHDIAQASGYLHGRLLDVGCGRRPYAVLFTDVESYIGFDAIAQPGGADATGLATALPFADAQFDSILCTQTLEHVDDPQQALVEMARVLRPGGYLVLTAPQAWRIHEQPHDFFRYTRYGLTALAERAGLEVKQLKAQGGVWATIAQIINNAIHVRFAGRMHRFLLYGLYLSNNLLFGWLDTVWRDDDETTNYMMIAQKAEREAYGLPPMSRSTA